MADAKQCDRCREFYFPSDVTSSVQTIPYAAKGWTKTYDLCFTCTENHIKFMDNTLLVTETEQETTSSLTIDEMTNINKKREKYGFTAL